MLAAAWIAVSAVVRLTGDGGEIDATWYAAAMLGLVLVIDAARATTSHRVAVREGSAALGANAVHFAADFAGTLAVIVGLGLTALGHPARRLARGALRRLPRRLRRDPARTLERRMR